MAGQDPQKAHEPALAEQQRSSVLWTTTLWVAKKEFATKLATTSLAPYYTVRVLTSQTALKKSFKIKSRPLCSPS